MGKVLTLLPNSIARETPTVEMRSLKEPVGLSDSSLKYKLSNPSFFDNCLPRTRGGIALPKGNDTLPQCQRK